MSDFDAIVVGSGISGGWAGKELTQRGLKVLIIERGRDIEPAKDYTDMLDPWETKNLDRVPEDEVARDYAIQNDLYAFKESTKHFWVKDSEHPYHTARDKPYKWRRGYQLGGRSLMWGRLCYRWSPMDFEANLKDGHGVDWPIRYEDIAPWYDKIESFIGVSGTAEGLSQLPDGNFLPPFEMTCPETEFKKRLEANYPARKLIIGRVANLRRVTDQQAALGRGQCQVRNQCFHGCSFGAYFSSVSATIPAARLTGNLTILTDTIVNSINYDARTQKVTGVNVIDTQTRERRIYNARLIFLNASTIATALILLNSKSESFPNGLANRSDQVGRNLMDHVRGPRISATLPGFENEYYSGRRPTPSYIPRYRNVTKADESYLRGFAFQVYCARPGWSGNRPGIGEAFKMSNRTPGDWCVTLDMFGETLPNSENRVQIYQGGTDKWGGAIADIDAAMGENERKLVRAASKDAVEILQKIGAVDIDSPEPETIVPSIPGDCIHEMGTARMGRDPKTSVLNAWNQCHDVGNLFITDGACMASTAVQNPSLTYMALSARAAHHAADLLAAGNL